MCHSRPFPWIKRLPADVPLAGMTPAQWTEEGLPVMPRFSMEATETDFALRAFFDQPLIMLGHHWDAADKYALFERAAGAANALGDVHWMGADAMARSNYEWRRDGNVLHVRGYSKRLDVVVPEGVEAIEVEIPAIGETAEPGVWEIDGAESTGVRENGALRGPLTKVSGGTCTVRLRHAMPVDPAIVESLSTPLQHIARRIATEMRDRCRPLTGR
jgi:hypothetical protein